MLVAGFESPREKYCVPSILTKRGITHKRVVQIAGKYIEVLFSVIQDEQKRVEARDLLNSRYGWRGYGSAHELHSDIRHTTFVAEIEDQVVGTMTLAVDSDSDRDLAIDRTFADLAGAIRREAGGRICELTKLAFDEGVRSKEVLAGLFHMAFIYGTAHTDCTDLFIEVNPRHVRFYELMLGFLGVGSVRTNASVDAPSRLMRLGVESIRKNIRELAGARVHSNARSLYPYFFPPEEERQVRRLLDLAFLSPTARSEQYRECAGERPDASIDEDACAVDYFNAAQMRSAA
jgi:hypothetical protein